MKVERFSDGIAVCGDATTHEVFDFVVAETGPLPLAIADPPYGNIVNEAWDKTKDTDEQFAGWMVVWTKLWSQALLPGAAFYVWGGIGRPGFRPFIRYLTDVEEATTFELANLITWKKKRGYGVQNNYLFTREECAYFVKGNAKKPRCFNVPLLDEKRGYSGYNAKYPAKSEFYRRTNVWTDITEIMRGKQHPTQKQQRVIEVPIEVHTQPKEWVLDPFAGGGTTAFACRKLGRLFVVIEKDEALFDDMVTRLKQDRCEQEKPRELKSASVDHMMEHDNRTDDTTGKPADPSGIYEAVSVEKCICGVSG